MNLPSTPISRLAVLLGGAIYFVMGAIQATHGDFGGTHNTIDSTAEYLVTGGFAAALFLTAPAYRIIGARTPRAAIAAMVPQLVLGAMCVASVIRGEDPSFFNAVAPICLLTWLVASVFIARGLDGIGRVRWAIPALVIVTIGLSPIGGSMLTGAFWMALAARSARQPALA